MTGSETTTLVSLLAVTLKTPLEATACRGTENRYLVGAGAADIAVDRIFAAANIERRAVVDGLDLAL